MKKISHCLWYNRNAEEAARFYVSIFKDGKLGRMNHYSEEGFEFHGMPKGTVMTVEFSIAGQDYIAINGGSLFKHSEAFSIMVNCDSQEEIDTYWEKLLAGGGEASQCGWLKDRFGVSWQIHPTILADMMMDRDLEKVKRVTHAFMQMQKYDIAALRRAYEGK